MPLIVEDGTGKADANALCSVEFADDYFALRGITSWDGTDAEKEARIVQATDYIGLLRLKGHREFDDQALSFPRIMFGKDELPLDVLKATAEYALVAKDGPLLSNPTYDASGRHVKSETKKMEGMEKKIEYSEFQEPIQMRSYPMADRLMRPYVIAGNVSFVTR